MANPIKTLDRPFEVKADSIKADGRFTGHASVFGELDSQRDIVVKGAFVNSLQRDYEQRGRKVPMLWQHDRRRPIGVYDTIKEDDIGLFVEGHINLDVQQGKEAHALMKQGALTGLSIGYRTINYEMNEDQSVRRLIELELWEVSPVTFPAGDSARISAVKSIEGLATMSEVEDYLRDACGLSRKEAVTLVARIKATATQSDSADGTDPSVKKALDILRTL